jgi:type II secretory ATPase GspE/PulE/Tfp pilus assembly ATPase PilB-like protein
MSKDLNSIEDLINSSSGGSQSSNDPAVYAFHKKQGEIKVKELEREAQKRSISLQTPYLNLIGFVIDSESMKIISEEKAKELRVVCFYYDGKRLNLAAEKPDERTMELADELKSRHHCKVEIYCVSSHSMDYALRLYRAMPKMKESRRELELTKENMDKFSVKFSSFDDLQKEIDKAQITDIISMIMAASIKTEASDIHIEAEESYLKVRFRIDGVLHDVAKIDSALWKKIISRLKVIAHVKINVNDKPQDGRITISSSEGRVDIRVSFLPTNYGESVVMRLLRSNLASFSYDDLGLRGRAYERLKQEIDRPNGMIITTGPTGSGKTTTLYAILKKLNKPETKIITVEDPIEYQLEGINQSQISKNFSFAQGLKSIVRQDPDILMIGEIRDLETAEIAIQAALTGHLVLSTIHTNDAAGTVPRLLSMGAKPFLLAPSINAMIGQRLVRRLCAACKKEAKLEVEIMEKVKKILEKLPEKEKSKLNMENLIFFKSPGCESCQNLGYKGQMGIYEVMIMTPEIEKLILSGQVSEYQMRESAAAEGTVSMVQDGILKALDGITDIDEVFRVAGKDEK